MSLLGLLGIVSAVIGIKKGYEGLKQQDEAKWVMAEAKTIFNNAQNELDLWKNTTTNSLVSLGKLKLEVWDGEFGRFIKISEIVKGLGLERFIKEMNKKYPIFPEDDNLIQKHDLLDSQELEQLRELSANAADLIGGGIATLSTGSLLAVAVYNGVSALGVASTGTGIGTLSGIAAKNATLAWLGGGSLLSGGGGIAAGISVLGGIVLAPIFAVAGIMVKSKASENLREAHLNLHKAKEAAVEMEKATAELKQLNQISNTFGDCITVARDELALVLDSLEDKIYNIYDEIVAKTKKTFWYKTKRAFGFDTIKLKTNNLTPSQLEMLSDAYFHADILRTTLLTPILDTQGKITDSSLKFMDKFKGDSDH